VTLHKQRRLRAPLLLGDSVSARMRSFWNFAKARRKRDEYFAPIITLWRVLVASTTESLLTRDARG